MGNFDDAGKGVVKIEVRCAGCGETRMVELIGRNWVCSVCAWEWPAVRATAAPEYPCAK